MAVVRELALVSRVITSFSVKSVWKAILFLSEAHHCTNMKGYRGSQEPSNPSKWRTEAEEFTICQPRHVALYCGPRFIPRLLQLNLEEGGPTQSSRNPLASI